MKSDKIFDVDASYKGDDVKVIEFTAEFENTPIKVEFSKTDITGDKELAGAKLSVIDKEGTVVESWTSKAGKTHMIERLPVGKYIPKYFILFVAMVNGTISLILFLFPHC